MFCIAVFSVNGDLDKRDVDKKHQARIQIENRIFDIIKANEIIEEVTPNNGE